MFARVVVVVPLVGSVRWKAATASAMVGAMSPTATMTRNGAAASHGPTRKRRRRGTGAGPGSPAPPRCALTAVAVTSARQRRGPLGDEDLLGRVDLRAGRELGLAGDLRQRRGVRGVDRAGL